MTAVFAFKKDLLTIKIPPTLSSDGIFYKLSTLNYFITCALIPSRSSRALMVGSPPRKRT